MKEEEEPVLLSIVGVAFGVEPELGEICIQAGAGLVYLNSSVNDSLAEYLIPQQHFYRFRVSVNGEELAILRSEELVCVQAEEGVYNVRVQALPGNDPLVGALPQGLSMPRATKAITVLAGATESRSIEMYGDPDLTLSPRTMGLVDDGPRCDCTSVRPMFRTLRAPPPPEPVDLQRYKADAFDLDLFEE